VDHTNSKLGDAPSKLSETDWYSIAIIAAGVTAFAIAQGASYPLTALMLANRGASDFVVSLGTVSLMFGMGLSVLFGPYLTRGMRAKSVMVSGLIGMGVVFTAFVVIDSLAVWFLLRFFQGVFSNAVIVYAQAWLNVAAADNVRGRVSSGWGSSMALGFALGPMLIPLLGTENGLAFLACAALVTTVALGFGLSLGRAKAEPQMFKLTDLPRFARAEPYLVIMVLAWGFAETQVIALAPIHMMTFGVSAGVAATFVTMINLGVFICQPFVGFLLDIWNRWLVAAGCFLVTGIMFGLLIVIPATSWWVWILGALGGGGLSCIFTCALSITGSRYSGPMLLAATSTYTLLYAAGGVVGPPVAGFSSSIVAGTIFLPVMLTGAVGFIFIVILYLRNKLGQAPST